MSNIWHALFSLLIQILGNWSIFPLTFGSLRYMPVAGYTMARMLGLHRTPEGLEINLSTKNGQNDRYMINGQQFLLYYSLEGHEYSQ